jgi:hypothetical protein
VSKHNLRPIQVNRLDYGDVFLLIVWLVCMVVIMCTDGIAKDIAFAVSMSVAGVVLYRGIVGVTSRRSDENDH